MTDALPKLVVIVGPTAVGKTGLSLELAAHFNGEIVNADATAMYRHLNIGSAKPSAQERQEVRHHLIDIVPPDTLVTVAQYQQLAYKAIDDILNRGKIPFLVGGSGLYVRSVVEGYKIPPVPPNQRLRNTLEDKARERGSKWLHDQLADVDPVAAARIHPANIRRVVRALEVHKTTGVPISEYWRTRAVRHDAIMIGLIRDREDLYRRIDLRVEQMLTQGLVREIRQILAMGYSCEIPAFSAIGYKELVPYIKGQADLEEAVDRIKSATRKLARQQLNTWFRPDDPRINWFEPDTPGTFESIADLLESHEICPIGQSLD